MYMSVLARAEWGNSSVLWNRCIVDVYRFVESKFQY